MRNEPLKVGRVPFLCMGGYSTEKIKQTLCLDGAQSDNKDSEIRFPRASFMLRVSDFLFCLCGHLISSWSPVRIIDTNAIRLENRPQGLDEMITEVCRV